MLSMVYSLNHANEVKDQCHMVNQQQKIKHIHNEFSLPRFNSLELSKNIGSEGIVCITHLTFDPAVSEEVF